MQAFRANIEAAKVAKLNTYDIDTVSYAKGAETIYVLVDFTKFTHLKWRDFMNHMMVVKPTTLNIHMRGFNDLPDIILLEILHDFNKFVGSTAVNITGLTVNNDMLREIIQKAEVNIPTPLKMKLDIAQFGESWWREAMEAAIKVKVSLVYVTLINFDGSHKSEIYEIFSYFDRMIGATITMEDFPFGYDHYLDDQADGADDNDE